MHDLVRLEGSSMIDDMHEDHLSAMRNVLKEALYHVANLVDICHSLGFMVVGGTSRSEEEEMLSNAEAFLNEQKWIKNGKKD